jgi:integrase/recombinase XerD
MFSGSENHISIRCVQEFIRKAAKHAGIKKNAHTHTLRHSFATHLIQNGYDIGSVQSLLGHESPQTTMRYIHIAAKKLINVESPLDNLQSDLISKRTPK